MDRLTPLEIERMEFPRRFRGLDPHSVELALSRCSEEIARLKSELSDCRAENLRQKDQVELFLTQESSLKEALIMAQRAADETRSLAHREADLIREKALGHAAEVQKDAELAIFRLNFEVDRLKRERSQIVNQIRLLLEAQLRSLTAAEETIAKGAVTLEIQEQVAQ